MTSDKSLEIYPGGEVVKTGMNFPERLLAWGKRRFVRSPAVAFIPQVQEEELYPRKAKTLLSTLPRLFAET